MTNELCLLKEALDKKAEVLQQILDRSKEQLALVDAKELDMARFDALVDEKDLLLQNMERLDEGFDRIYQAIRDELPDKKSQYKTEIVAIQKAITRTVELGAEIHTTETRTKDKLSNVIMRSKKAFSQKRTSMKAAADYYKTSNNLQIMDSYFMDQKK